MTKILIIEDNEKNLKLFKLVLGSRGHELSIATDGEEGVLKAKEIIPDLIVMDIRMPKMNGIAALSLLKENEATRNIPVIATTAFAMKGDREQILRHGFTDYISKPIRVDDFLERIDNILADARKDD